MQLNNEFELLESTGGTGDMRLCRLISPGEGSSGLYSKQVLQRAVGLYQKGMKVFKDHPSASEHRDRPERSVSDIAGYLESAGEWRDYPAPGIYAWIKFLPKYSELIRHAGKTLGLSHMASGQIESKVEGGVIKKIVKSIDAVFSVDLVTTPGRGGRICEAAARARISPNEAGLMYHRSLVESGLKPETATLILEQMDGKPFTPEQASVSEADEMLIKSYVESGMREDTARKIVSNLG